MEIVLARIRQDYWVLQGRCLLRKIKHACVTCRRYDAKAADEISTDLPEDRVVHRSPFALCGIDYAGPLLIQPKGEKVWISLFVCGTTRGVHLELVNSLRVDDFLLAFRHFTARQGMPTRIRSDNATAYVAASKILNINWISKPPAAP